MPDTQSNNKRIAKNTMMLYFRMLFSMFVSLFTSRVILQTLGVEDYGTYNVVGGIVTMFTFINGGMTSSTQRYLNFELASRDGNRLRSVFNTSLQIHAIISIIIILLAETAGMWFLLEKLVIPDERMTAAIWVFQFSIIACVVNIMSTPYNADIIAHERMSAFAYISILEVVLKLAIVYLLIILPFDKLIVYALLLLIVQLFIRYIYTSYCNKHFPETLVEWKINKSLLKDMASFAGWSFWGNLAGALYSQGLNMMLNIFFGPIVNAARGIAVQVQSAVQSFVSNFQTALNPQITKNYACNNLVQMHSLMFRSARFSFLLLFFLSFPILLETEFILKLWLKNVPANAVIFTQIMICISLIYTTSNPCVIANQATGKVKVYQMVVGGILLTIIPISYIVLKIGAPAYSVFLVHLCVESVAQFSRMYMLRNLINLPMREYLKNIYIPIFATVAASIVLPLLVRFQLPVGWQRLFAVGITSVFSVGISASLIGVTKHEREFLIDKVLRLLKVRK